MGLDALGKAGCETFMRAAQPTHPMLIDAHHELAAKFGVVNIPSAIWIDEAGRIVRPAEAAPAPPAAPTAVQNFDFSAVPERLQQMMAEAMKIPSDPEGYHAALRDWVEKGSASEFALSAQQVIKRSRPRSAEVALGHAHFELATGLEAKGEHQLAIAHFRKAHELVPDSWTFRRQAWSLEPGGDGPLARFWQGPSEDSPEDWPYEGDWLADVRAVGAENYSESFKP